MKKLVLLLLMLMSISLLSATQKLNTKFNLNAKVFDYGQNIVSVEIDTSKVKGINVKALTLDTFKVHAKGELPANVYFPIDNDKTKAFGLFDVDREIVKISVNRKGNIVLDLKYGQNVLGSSTLSYIGGDVSRNVLLDLEYTVTQQEDIKLYNGNVISKDSKYKQGNVLDEEADKFESKKHKNGLTYQYFAPKKVKNRKNPLIIWFHGNGEGGYDGYVNNVSQKLANRGVVAFGEAKTQRIFGGAYVVAPQAPDTWYNNYSKDYITKVKELIDSVVKNNKNIDTNRIYIFGASAGGYMSLRMGIEYPEYFRAINVSAPAINLAPERGGVATTEQDLEKLSKIPVWFVHAENDLTVKYETSSKWAYEILKEKNNNVILSNYSDVKVGETEYNGHWSWIYSLRNMPVNDNGKNLFEWVSSLR